MGFRDGLGAVVCNEVLSKLHAIDFEHYFYHLLLIFMKPS